MKISVAVTSQTLNCINKVSVPIEVVKQIPIEVVLADEPVTIDTQLQVDMMLGNDYYDDVIRGKKVQLAPGFWLLDSDFGWIVSGRVSEGVSQSMDRQPCNDVGMQVLVDNDSVNKFDPFSVTPKDLPGPLEDLWNLGTIGIQDEKNPILDDDAIDQFNKTVHFQNGRYQVTFP